MTRILLGRVISSGDEIQNLLHQKVAKEKGWQSSQPEKTGEIAQALVGQGYSQVRAADRETDILQDEPRPCGTTTAMCHSHAKTQVIDIPR